MSELTILLLVATLVLFGIGLKIRDVRLNALTMTVGICTIGQIFLDDAVTDSQVPFVLLPVVVVLIFTAISLMNLDGGKRR